VNELINHYHFSKSKETSLGGEMASEVQARGSRNIVGSFAGSTLEVGKKIKLVIHSEARRSDSGLRLFAPDKNANSRGEGKTTGNRCDRNWRWPVQDERYRRRNDDSHCDSCCATADA
jgi:hypothetical protein